MSDQIIMVAEASIVLGKADELKTLYEKLAVHVKETEPDSRTYLCHFSEDNTEWRIIEHYNSSEAVFVHMGNMAAFTEELDRCRKLKRVSVYGNPSETLRKGIEQSGIDAKIFPFHCGLVR